MFLIVYMAYGWRLKPKKLRPFLVVFSSGAELVLRFGWIIAVGKNNKIKKNIGGIHAFNWTVWKISTRVND